MKKNTVNNTAFTLVTWGGCVIISLMLIYALLITSVEIAAYGDFDFYQKEYEKYEVADDLQMEMEDIMSVTEEMMSYLRGDRETLIIETTVNGVKREFFNKSEISHMEDVRVLFVGGIKGRRVCMSLAMVLLLLLILCKFEWKRILPRAFCYTTVGFGAVIATLGILFATNFDKCFTIFHKMFFEGDTWIFDPRTSLMINMLPEGLFYDFTTRIVLIFLGIMMGAFIIARIVIKKMD